MVDINVRCVFLPLQYHHRKVQSLLSITNITNDPINFKVRTTHPRDVVAEPHTGVLQPADTAEVWVWWNPETAVGDTEDYTALTPPKQPKIQVEAKSVIDVVKPLKPIVVPISFAEPSEGEEFHYKVGTQVFSSFVKPLAGYHLSKSTRTQAAWAQVIEAGDARPTPKDILPGTNYQRSKQERYFRPRQLDIRNGELERQGFLKQRQEYQGSLKQALSTELRDRQERVVRERAVEQMKVMMEQVYAYQLMRQSEAHANKKDCVCVIS